MASKRSLLTDLLTEEVVVFTSQKVLMQTTDGEISEVNYSVDGVFVDFENDWVLLSRNDGPCVINRRHIVDISIKNTTPALLEPKPPIEDMN